MLEILGADAEAALRAGENIVALGRAHGLMLFLARGALHSAWARAKLGDRDAGTAELRQALADYASGGNKLFVPFHRGLLAEIETERQGAEAALAGIDEALAPARETGEHWFDAALHRIRGEILVKQNPAAEATFLAAITVAQSQKARSFELRAALSLAKLYQSTGRPIDAHDVLAPALDGFSPTPEFPQIAEAKTLFDTLAETEEVSAAIAARKHRLQLQLAFGNALMAARGYGAAETTAPFEHAREITVSIEDAPERFAVLHGLWAGSYVRGEFDPVRELADAFLHEVEAQPLSPEAGVAYRGKGLTHIFAGGFGEARTQLERALANFDPERDGDFAFRYGFDPGVAAMSHLALTLWPLGEFDQARRHLTNSTARSAEITRLATIAFASLQAAFFELMRRDYERAEPHARTLARLAREHDMVMWQVYGTFFEGWMAWRTGDRDAGVLGNAQRRCATRRAENRRSCEFGQISVGRS